MKQFTTISGFIAAEITGADITSLLQLLTREGVVLYRVQQKDMLTVFIWVRRRDVAKIKHIADRQGASFKVIKRKGIYWLWISFIRRPVIIAGFLLIMLLSWFVPTRILFVSVEGNESTPTNLILDRAADCGVSFGADRRDVRSEKVKNSLLEVLPELDWAGINTYGCTAVISVSEKTQSSESSDKHKVSSIVAERDGIISSCTVIRGNPVCKIGEAVRAGETLVSGYTDCGIKIQATRAQAEIYATTMRQLTVLSPLDYIQKGQIRCEETRYSLILGKKRINLSKDSGNFTSVCDKMYWQYYCVLPGGFQLPISVVVERIYCKEKASITEASEMSQVCTEKFAQDYLQETMLSGSILAKVETQDIGSAVYMLSGRYVCLEMIGRERSEEIIKHHG